MVPFRYGVLNTDADLVIFERQLPDPFASQTVVPVNPGPEQRTGVAPDISMQPTPPTSTQAIATPSASSEPDVHPRIPYWLQQAERFLRVIVRMYLGLLVCCAPWYPAAWDSNPLFSSSPGLMAFVTHGAVRGIVSGLGILNLWIAVRDALRGRGDSSGN
jgi:hypothetical protein